MSELDQLIAEQAREMRHRHTQPPQPGTVPLGNMEAFLSDGEIEDPHPSKRGGYHRECPYHGRSALTYVGARQELRCLRCEVARKKEWDQNHPDLYKARMVRHNQRNMERYRRDPGYRARKIAQVAEARRKRRAT